MLRQIALGGLAVSGSQGQLSARNFWLDCECPGTSLGHSIRSSTATPERPNSQILTPASRSQPDFDPPVLLSTFFGIVGSDRQCLPITGH